MSWSQGVPPPGAGPRPPERGRGPVAPPPGHRPPPLSAQPTQPVRRAAQPPYGPPVDRRSAEPAPTQQLRAPEPRPTHRPPVHRAAEYRDDRGDGGYGDDGYRDDDVYRDDRQRDRRSAAGHPTVRSWPILVVVAVIVAVVLLLMARGTTFSWVDYLVLGLAVVAGVSGWRHGMAVALLSFVGVLGGAVLGVRLAPVLAAGIAEGNARVVVSIVIVVLLVALGETTGVFIGRRIRDRLTGARSLHIDSTLGSVLQAFTVILASWLVALPLASASFPGLAAGVRGSEVLRTVDDVMPEAARALPDELRQLLDDSGFPAILDPFSETPIIEAAPPDPALAASPIVADVQDSVLKIRGRAPSCQRQLEGTGFVIGDGLVMTNAHVVAGTTDTGVEVVNRNGRIVELEAEVVLYDPAVDIAVLRVPELDAPALPFRPQPAEAGEPAIVLGYPLDGPYTPTSAVVRQRITLQGPDIYDAGQVSRDVYTVRAVVRSGNSGGPMIDPQGQVIGVVFGAALDDSETGFVLTNEQVATTVNPQAQLSREVETGACSG